MEFWKLNLRIGILEILKNYFKKIKLRIEFQKMKFKKIGILENWNIGKLEFWEVIFKSKFEGGILKIKFQKLESWKNYFENGISEN